MNEIATENLLEFDFPSFDITSFSEPQASQPVGEKYLVFCWGDELFAVSSKQVAEAVPMLPVTILPNAPEWLIGVANLRGEITSIVNLPSILKKKILAPAPKPKLVVLRSIYFESGVAFTADRINEIVTLPTKEIQFNGEKSPSIFATAIYKSHMLNLIDTERLFAALKL